MSAKHAILGLVVHQPSCACRIASEARRQLGFAQLAKAYPYWALDSLQTQGLVRRRDENGDPICKTISDGRAIYEATLTGARSFEDWMGSSLGNAKLRDDLPFRIAVVRPGDVPQLVELIRGREVACAEHAQHLRRCGQAELNLRSARLEQVGASELAFWHGRMDWLENVRNALERMWARICESQPDLPTRTQFDSPLLPSAEDYR